VSKSGSKLGRYLIKLIYGEILAVCKVKIGINSTKYLQSLIRNNTTVEDGLFIELNFGI